MKRVAVFQIGSLGDAVVTLPAWRAVRRHFADAEIVLVHDRQPHVPVVPGDVLAGADAPDHVISYRFETAHLRKLASALQLLVALKRLRCTVAVYLAPAQQPARSVARDRWFFQLCGVREFYGFVAFDREELHPRGLDGRPAAVAHEAVWRLRRLHLSGIPTDSVIATPYLEVPSDARSWALQWLRARRQHPHRLLVAVCPGAKQAANLWPIERFAEVGKALLDSERVELLIVGGPGERAAAAELVAAWGHALNAAGEASVLQSAGLLSQCAFAIGLDTGTTHLGAALGIPFVALYGERDHPGRWNPLGHQHVIIRNPVPCAGCGLRICPMENHPCMHGIETPVVIAAAMRMLAMVHPDRPVPQSESTRA